MKESPDLQATKHTPQAILSIMNSETISPISEEVAKSGSSFLTPVLNMIQSWFSDPIFVFLAGIVLLGLFLWYISSDQERVKRNAGSFFILGLLFFCGFSLTTRGINYGIDIDGGVSFTLKVEPKEIDGREELPGPDGMQRAADTVRERIDSTGAKEPVVMLQGRDKILVQIPETDPDRIAMQREIITRIAHLELLPVHPDNARLVASGQEFVPGYKLYEYEYSRDDGQTAGTEKLFLSKRESLTGSDVARAQPDAMHPGVVNVTLSRQGGDKMLRLTQHMTKGQDRLAVVLDGKVVTAPTVQSTLSQNFQISGMNGPGEAENVSRVLNNPLEAPLTVLKEQTVSATLGKTALQQAEYAGLAGILLICIFMIIYYRFAGIVAILAIIINAVILLGCMSLFDFTLTLPGIAGIILTIGVAIDANVLIYERLREEKEAKRSIYDSLTISFDKAFSAIFDSNITSLLTAVILFWLASGAIKGFAVTTSVGIVTSMIGALVVTRVLFFWAYKFGFVNERIKFLNIFGKSNFNFLGMRKISLVIAVVLCVAAIAGGITRGKSTLGMDFTGGASISYDIPSDVKVDYKQVERIATSVPNLHQTVRVQEFGTPNGNSTITVNCSVEDINTIVETINQQVTELAALEPPSQEITGPSLGKEFMIYSFYALLAGLVGIMIYLAIRFEWAFSVGAVVSIFFNVIVVLGSIIYSGGQLSLIHVGAILTVVGYTVNDTIVIFDRIREVLRYSDGTEDLASLMNEAINATLSRTILTSGSTLACILCLWTFGGPAMKDFSSAIFVGILVGSFSSIFIASPTVLYFSRKDSLHKQVNRNLAQP